eukprot:54287-Rhodomonas_salina.2
MVLSDGVLVQVHETQVTCAAALFFVPVRSSCCGGMLVLILDCSAGRCVPAAHGKCSRFGPLPFTKVAVEDAPVVPCRSVSIRYRECLNRKNCPGNAWSKRGGQAVFLMPHIEALKRNLACRLCV